MCIKFARAERICRHLAAMFQTEYIKRLVYKKAFELLEYSAIDGQYLGGKALEQACEEYSVVLEAITEGEMTVGYCVVRKGDDGSTDRTGH